MAPSIICKNVDIEFPIFENSHRSLKNTLMHLTTGGVIGNDSGKHPVVKAISNLTCEIKTGDRVGLVGHNGSGKTTLLRAFSGVYAPVQGTLEVQGKIASLLDVSMGLDPDATGYENIYLRGLMDGLMPDAIRSRSNEIAEFTDLGDYLELPVRTYSSGMLLRLAFAISTSVDADILIMDEWLSVGDSDFSKKAAERLDKLVSNASILVIASHNPELIDRVCNRQLYLEHGVVQSDERTQGNFVI